MKGSVWSDIFFHTPMKRNYTSPRPLTLLTTTCAVTFTLFIDNTNVCEVILLNITILNQLDKLYTNICLFVTKK